MNCSIRIAFLTLACIPLALLLMGGKAPQPVTQPTAEVKRGEYLVRLAGCSDCHTPRKQTPQGWQPDLERFLSGHPEGQSLSPLASTALAGSWTAATVGWTAWSGNWGVSYAANLTPDSRTGLGLWNREMFFKAMRTGKHYGASRELLPPMPWRSLAGLTDEDLAAVFAYLQSLPPVRNRVPDPDPQFSGLVTSRE